VSEQPAEHTFRLEDLIYPAVYIYFLEIAKN